MTSKGQTVAAVRRKFLEAAQAACAKYQRGEITEAALNIAIERLKAAKAPHRRA
jgi:hypothetical protein